MYYATQKHHSMVNRWEELRATTLTGAKREASKRFGGGLHGSVIHLIDATEEEFRSGQINDLSAWTKIIPAGKWQEPY